MITAPADVAVRLVRKDGGDTAPWTWYVISRTGEPAQLELRWTVDGVDKSATHPEVHGAEVECWEIDAELDPAIAAEDLDAHVGAVELDWEDPQGVARWRSTITIGTDVRTGRFLLPLRFQRHLEPFAESRWPEPVESVPLPV